MKNILTTKGTKANKGEKMVEIHIRFWTNKVASKAGNIAPKHARTSGMISVQSNASHGIKARKPTPFHSLLDLPSVIEEVLVQHGITLHADRRMKKYLG